MPIVVPLLESKQYTGTNGTEIMAWLSETVSLVSDDGQTLVLSYGGSIRTLYVGDWVIAAGGGHNFSTEQRAADYAASWRELAP